MPRPNILVIMSDQHNPSVMGCAGDTCIRTPHLDSLARDGLRCAGMYTPCPVCVPARMSFLTGRRPCENQVTSNSDILSSHIMTWPARLREAGYHTALIGRMHFEGPDQHHGFESTIEELQHWRDGCPVESAWASLRVPMNSYWSHREPVERFAGSGRSFVQYRDEVVCDHAVRFLRDRAGRDGRPFASVVGFYQPHPPYIGPRNLYHHYCSRLPPLEPQPTVPNYLRRIMDTTWEARDWHVPGPIAADQVQAARAAYYANIEHLDGLVGRLLEAVELAGHREDTLVIYCTDHGDMIGRMGVWGKSVFYDDSARIPMIARMPDIVPAGATTGQLCSLRDLGNTFCDIAGADPLRGSDGRSLWSILRGAGVDPEAYVESEITFPHPASGSSLRAASKMIRQGRWKLWIYCHDGEEHLSLFDLENDPAEHLDLGAASEHRSVVARLRDMVYTNWNPSSILAAERTRIADRSETDMAWTRIQRQPGYPIHSDLDQDVDTPHTRSMPRS